MLDNYFDDIDIEYEEAFPQDKEYKKWMEQLEKDYASEIASLNIDSDTEIFYDCEDDEDGDTEWE
ncbi:MAG TPA: hypothetical protein VFM18_16975 [Methanosarcina sp.]|nr:hypothetical protein [Methanosarcina sp.]